MHDDPLPGCTWLQCWNRALHLEFVVGCSDINMGTAHTPHRSCCKTALCNGGVDGARVEESLLVTAGNLTEGPAQPPVPADGPSVVTLLQHL